MFNVLVTGSSGQLGSEIKELSSNYGYNFFFTTSKNLDITDSKKVKLLIESNNVYHLSLNVTNQTSQCISTDSLLINVDKFINLNFPKICSQIVCYLL